MAGKGVDGGGVDGKGVDGKGVDGGEGGRRGGERFSHTANSRNVGNLGFNVLIHFPCIIEIPSVLHSYI